MLAHRHRTLTRVLSVSEMAKRTDATQTEIVAALRSIGAGWIATSEDARSGIDGVILWRGRAIPCEIKDGSQPASRRRLTDNELRTLRECERVGVPHVILLDADHAIETVLGIAR